MTADRWGFGRDGGDRLVVGGCDVVALAREHGTPLHVVDTELLRRTYRVFRDAFTGHMAALEGL